MTQRLEAAIFKLQQLPEAQQNEIAEIILQQIERETDSFWQELDHILEDSQIQTDIRVATLSKINIEQTLLKNLRELPSAEQQELLDFSEFLKNKVSLRKQIMTSKKRAEAWKKWAESHPKNSSALPDYALKRENIYE